MQFFYTSNPRSVKTPTRRRSIVSIGFARKDLRSPTEKLLVRREVLRPARLRVSVVPYIQIKRTVALKLCRFLSSSLWRLETHKEFTPISVHQKGLLFLHRAKIAQTTEGNVRMKANGVMTLSNIIDAIQMLQPRPDSLTG